ncbi:hypothetical protein HZC33_00750, partial [Candidatus Wolfebacteria bacterium]|nr:hypothetical protein [Candidatus Wolfebacteria bacterium]
RKVFDELVEKFKPLSKLSYFKGEKIGLDAANLFLLESAIGKYIWWFSDDDEFMPGAISRTLELVKKYPEITFIFVNFGFEKIENLAINRDDGFFKDGKDVLEVAGSNIGLLSSLFLRREEALLSLPLAKKYIKGFSFAALIPVFYNLSGDGKFYFLRGAYILHQVLHLRGLKEKIEENKKIIIAGGDIKNEYFNYFGVDFYNILKEFEYKFGKSFVKRILAKNFSALWRGILVGWVGGWDTPKGKRWKMFKLYWNFPEFWIAMPLFLMPLWVNILILILLFYK